MQYRYSSRVSQLQSSAVRDILKLTQGKDMISFAGGLPAEELFPVEAVREAANRVLTGGTGALQYGVTEGYMPLREQLCERMAAKQMKVQPQQMLLTTGSQQAIDLLVSVLTEPGDVILVEKPTYLAGLQVFALRGLQVIAAESDEHGMIPEDVERIIREHKPKLMYAVPTFGNPTGRVWSLERRKQLLALCKNNEIPIIEDDPYGDIKFDDETFPSLYSLEGEAEGGAVFYTSTFSKTVAPALRTGWAMGDSGVMTMAAKAKQAADIHSSTMDQQILSQLLKGFDLDAHISIIAKSYGERMNEMHKLLSMQPALRDVAWVKPRGGMFLWVELPEGLDAEALLKAAVRKGVAFVPGSSFYAEHPQRNTARLNYTYNTGARTQLGIERLVEAIGEFTARS
jgi:2-aminoadipate transaminase